MELLEWRLKGVAFPAGPAHSQNPGAFQLWAPTPRTLRGGMGFVRLTHTRRNPLFHHGGLAGSPFGGGD